MLKTIIKKFPCSLYLVPVCPVCELCTIKEGKSSSTLRVGSAGKQRNTYTYFCRRFHVFEVLVLICGRRVIAHWIRQDLPDATVLFPTSVLKKKYFKYIKTCAKNIEKKTYIYEISAFRSKVSRSQLSFRARKKRSVGSWCPTYIFLLPKTYINNLQQELGRKLMKPWRKIIFN